METFSNEFEKITDSVGTVDLMLFKFRAQIENMENFLKIAGKDGLSRGNGTNTLVPNPSPARLSGSRSSLHASYSGVHRLHPTKSGELSFSLSEAFREHSMTQAPKENLQALKDAAQTTDTTPAIFRKQRSKTESQMKILQSYKQGKVLETVPAASEKNSQQALPATQIPEINIIKPPEQKEDKDKVEDAKPAIVKSSGLNSPDTQSLNTPATPLKAKGKLISLASSPEKPRKNIIGTIRDWFRVPDLSNHGMIHSSVYSLKHSSKGNLFFHPESIGIKVWNSIIRLILLITLILFLPAISFQDTLNQFLPGLSIFQTVVLLIDNYFKYNTAVVIDGEFKTTRRDIRNFHFKKGYWLLDLIVIFPYAVITHNVSNVDSDLRTYLNLLSFANAFAFFRLIFGYKRKYFFQERATVLYEDLGINSALLDSFTILASMIFYWHINACVVMILRHLGISEGIDHYATEWIQYTENVFVAAGVMLANGFGSPVPHSIVDQWLEVLNMTISATFLAVYIGNLSAFMIGLDSSGKKYNEIIEEVNQYINYKGFGNSLRERIIKYYQFKYVGGKYFDEQRILNELNEPLRKHIALRECEDLVLKVPFFKDADKFFIAQLVMILEVHHYLPGDCIIEEGTTGQHMYFTATGVVEVVIGGIPKFKLQSGSFFGEIALLMERTTRTATVRAATKCIVYSISRESFNIILQLYPAMEETIRKVAEERLKNDKKK